jgi:hypothetical protein
MESVNAIRVLWEEGLKGGMNGTSPWKCAFFVSGRISRMVTFFYLMETVRPES